jgi:hypothetical protein
MRTNRIMRHASGFTKKLFRRFHRLPSGRAKKTAAWWAALKNGDWREAENYAAAALAFGAYLALTAACFRFK